MVNEKERALSKLKALLTPEEQEELIKGYKNIVPLKDNEQKAYTEKKRGNRQSKNEKKSQADTLVEVASQAKFFHDDAGEPYAIVPIDGHCEIWPLDSKQFIRWLAGKAYETTKKVPNPEAIRSALNVLEGIAVFKAKEYKLYNRVAQYKDEIWYDLSNSQWQAVRINAEGWTIVNKPPILFKRYAHQASQVTPSKNGDIRLVLSFINLKDREVLFLVYLVSCFIPDIPHPILTLYGEKGASKTTTFKIIKKIVDPSAVETLSFPQDINGLIQQLAHHWWAGFDNISNLSTVISDALCRAVTGEGMPKRKLYTDDEDFIYRFKRCIGLNGINTVASKEDLLDRSVLFGLERISPDKRKEEAILWKEFEEVRPYILGGIFDVLSKAMSIYPTVKLPSLPRMADFAKWGYAIAEAIEGGYGEQFFKEYADNLQRLNEEAIHANPVATAIIAFMEDKEEWSGRPSDLLESLNKVAEKELIDTKAKTWPKSPNTLTRNLNRIKSNLAEAGIEYIYEGHTMIGTRITFRKNNKNTVITVISSEMALSSQKSHDDNMTIHDNNDDIVSSSSSLSSCLKPACRADYDDYDDNDDNLSILTEDISLHEGEI